MGTKAQLLERPTLLITQGAKACAQSGKQLAKRFGCGIHFGRNSRIYAHSAIYFFDASTNVGKVCPCARRERSGILRFAQNDTKIIRSELHKANHSELHKTKADSGTRTEFAQHRDQLRIASAPSSITPPRSTVAYTPTLAALCCAAVFRMPRSRGNSLCASVVMTQRRVGRLI